MNPIELFVVDNDLPSREAAASLGLPTADLQAGGLEIQKRIAETGGILQVIITGTQATIANSVEAMHLGAFTFIEKPYVAEELRAAIRSALDQSRQMHAARQHLALGRCRLKSLSVRERSVLDLIICGEPNKVIAVRLQLSRRTVDRTRADIYIKLVVKSAVDAARLIAELA